MCKYLPKVHLHTESHQDRFRNKKVFSCVPHLLWNRPWSNEVCKMNLFRAGWHNFWHRKLIFSAPHLRSCRFITVARARLKVPAKNPTALLFLSRGKQEERKTTTTIQCFFMEWVKWDMLSAHICSQREKWHAKVQICYAQKLFSNNTIVFETFTFHHLPKLPLISCCL